MQAAAEVYDAVILAVPLELSGIQLLGVGQLDLPARSYQRVVTTVVSSSGLRPSYFGVQRLPGTAGVSRLAAHAGQHLGMLMLVIGVRPMAHALKVHARLSRLSCCREADLHKQGGQDAVLCHQPTGHQASGGAPIVQALFACPVEPEAAEQHL